MKILSEGRKYDDWTMQVICTGRGNGTKGCEAELEINFDDIRHCTPIETESWGGREEAVCVKCPCCSVVTDLKKESWPIHKKLAKKWTKTWHDSAYNESTNL